jgi:hypothetical protein
VVDVDERHWEHELRCIENTSLAPANPEPAT